MTVKNQTYSIELTAKELEVLEAALSMSYNTLFLRVNPKYAGEEYDNFYTDAVELPIKQLIEKGEIGTLKEITHLIQREVGHSQSW